MGGKEKVCWQTANLFEFIFHFYRYSYINSYILSYISFAEFFWLLFIAVVQFGRGKFVSHGKYYVQYNSFVGKNRV